MTRIGRCTKPGLGLWLGCEVDVSEMGMGDLDGRADCGTRVDNPRNTAQQGDSQTLREVHAEGSLRASGVGGRLGCKLDEVATRVRHSAAVLHGDGQGEVALGLARFLPNTKLLGDPGVIRRARSCALDVRGSRGDGRAKVNDAVGFGGIIGFEEDVRAFLGPHWNHIEEGGGVGRAQSSRARRGSVGRVT